LYQIFLIIQYIVIFIIKTIKMNNYGADFTFSVFFQTIGDAYLRLSDAVFGHYRK